MIPLAARANHLRTRHGHEHSRVTFVELFFDLVFVFAVTQLSHGLLEHLTPLGALPGNRSRCDPRAR
jgi:low temperature requirement protein LtrA